jgi:uncharacterized membrane protein YoaK (UPF0700 family)
MYFRQTSLYSFTFSIVAGVVNVLGIKKLSIVLTNVTGHLSEAIMVSNSDFYDDAILTPLLYVLMYATGAFWSFWCFNYGQKKHYTWPKVLPVLVNIGIFLYALLTQSLPMLALFFAMSSQNGIGSNHSYAQVKPSQITGVVMNAMQDLSKYFLEENPQQQSQSLTEFIIKALNIAGFAVGGLLALHYNVVNVLWVPVVFYTLLGLLIVTKRL